MKHPIDPKIDCVFKAILGAEDNINLLIHFLNAILREELDSPIVAVEILNPYNEKETSQEKLSIVDVKARDQEGRIFQIEIQIGDITWIEMVEQIASKQKPYILATGASTTDDVIRAVGAALAINPQLALLQCNTNYTGDLDNLRYVQLNVLKTYRSMFPEMILGLSDHTLGHTTVLGAVSLGARIIEKHFTDDVNRVGPDHKFSMIPKSWRDMVDRTRELEAALGTGLKKVEENELQTVVLQRRALRLVRDVSAGHVLTKDDLTVLRPAPSGALLPYEIGQVLGRQLRAAKVRGQHLTHSDLG